MISLIAAVDLDGGIGKNNTLPWKIKEDLQLFKKITTGNTIVIGRKTFESIGKPLPNRKNLVLSNSSIVIPGALCFTSKTDILAIECLEPEKNYFIIGGSEIYKLFEAHVCEVYLTVVNGKYDCDTFLNLDFLNDFYLESQENLLNTDQNIVCKFMKLRRIDSEQVSCKDVLFKF